MKTYYTKFNFTLIVGDEEHKGPSNAKYQRPISPIDVTEEDYSQLLKNHRRKHKECDIMVSIGILQK